MTGIVVEQLRMARCPETVAQWKWFRVRTSQGIICAAGDQECREGEQVLLVTGETGRTFCMGCPGDWCVAGVLAGSGKNG